jgi:hypothetical protein
MLGGAICHLLLNPLDELIALEHHRISAMIFLMWNQFPAAHC